MKNSALSIILIASAILFMSFRSEEKIIPSGDIIKKTMPVQAFTDIVVSHGIEIVFTQGTRSVVVESHENLFEYLIVSVDENVLRIGFPHEWTITGNVIKKNINIGGKHKTKVYISSEVLQSITASGGSKVTINKGIAAKKLKLTGSGGSSFTANVNSSDLTIKLSGGSKMAIEGEANICDLKVSGGSQFTGKAFIIEKLKANVSGGSIAEVNVTDELSCRASGASQMYYNGIPNIIRNNCSGESKIEPRR